MIVTARSTNTYLLTSKDIFQDIFIPLNERQGFITGRSPIIPVYSYRCIGILENSREYYDLLNNLEKKLAGLGSIYSRFTGSLPILPVNEINDKTQNIWENINMGEHAITHLIPLLKNSDVFPKFSINALNLSFEKSFSDTLSLYHKNTLNLSSTILKNFCLKILSWAFKYIPSLFQSFDINNMGQKPFYNPKVLFYGDIKEHEIYFLFLLSKLGSDVLYLHTLSEGKFSNIDINCNYFYLYKLPNTEPLKEFPIYQLEVCKPQPIVTQQTAIKPIEAAVPPVIKDSGGIVESRERTFEELALLSTSTVMLKIYNHNNEVIGSGSGVIIDKNGLIVTNYHVVDGGLYFGVVFEGMDEHCQYKTYTVINANPQRDLALIKIHLKTKPIPIDTQNDVVRGQRVVAIGSPLGLMNTFSDGIISGFRRSDKDDFIQTTAPVSPGSSGGALFNMYGELVGITSAVFIHGQNLNLAVPSKYVKELMEHKFSIMNLEIMNNYYFFLFENIKVEFDGFFKYVSSENTYKVALYQCKHDRNNLLDLFNNQKFKESLESYFIDNIKGLTAKYGIEKYDLELGAHNYMFYYSCHFGKITDKGWKYVDDE